MAKAQQKRRLEQNIPEPRHALIPASHGHSLGWFAGIQSADAVAPKVLFAALQDLTLVFPLMVARAITRLASLAQ